MIDTLNAIIRGAIARLSQQMQQDLPPIIAAVVILLVAFLFARMARWLVLRVFKGIELDLWLRRSGFSAILNPSGTLHASRLAARTASWGIMLAGLLAALNALGTQIAARLVDGIVLLFPRLVVGGLIVLAGMWLGQYLGRSALIWAVNEDIPSPRRVALAVRGLVMFAAVVVAADTLNFARAVFLAAFVVVMGGAALAGGLAIGLGSRDAVHRYLGGHSRDTEPERAHSAGNGTLWNHL